MTRTLKFLTVVLVAGLGVWGCAQGPGGEKSGTDRKLRELEIRCARLEEDYRVAAAAKEQARQKCADLEREQAELRKAQEELQKEVEEARAVKQERDQLLQQLEQQKNEIKSLLERRDKIRAAMLRVQEEIDSMTPGTTTPTTGSAPVISTSGGSGF